MPTFSYVFLSAATAVFGPWEKVSISDILKPVPEAIYSTSLGAVSRKEQIKPVSDACPIYESGQVVGFRFNCPQSVRRASHGGPLVPSASDS